MLTAVKKAKRFVKDHPTLTACVITAAVASKITYEISTDHVLEKVTDFVYEKGYEAGQIETYLDVAYDFIDQKGLTTEFISFATVPA